MSSRETNDQALRDVLKSQAQQFTADTGITEEAATLLLEGHGKEAATRFLEATPLEEWMYLAILMEANAMLARQANGESRQ
jgi:hypothetical protein